MLITSVNNERIRELVKLKDKKYRDKIGLFFVEGLDIVKEAYENGVLEHIYILVLGSLDCILSTTSPYNFINVSLF